MGKGQPHATPVVSQGISGMTTLNHVEVTKLLALGCGCGSGRGEGGHGQGVLVGPRVAAITVEEVSERELAHLHYPFSPMNIIEDGTNIRFCCHYDLPTYN